MGVAKHGSSLLLLPLLTLASDVEGVMVIFCSYFLFRLELSLSLSTNSWKMKSLTSGHEVVFVALSLVLGGSLYRAESQGHLSMVLFLKILCQIFGYRCGEVKLG